MSLTLLLLPSLVLLLLLRLDLRAPLRRLTPHVLAQPRCDNLLASIRLALQVLTTALVLAPKVRHLRHEIRLTNHELRVVGRLTNLELLSPQQIGM